jgi:hypothetical protein
MPFCLCLVEIKLRSDKINGGRNVTLFERKVDLRSLKVILIRKQLISG